MPGTCDWLAEYEARKISWDKNIPTHPNLNIEDLEWGLKFVWFRCSWEFKDNLELGL